MTDKTNMDLDIPYILEHYENGVEGAHMCLAYSMDAILKTEELDTPGIDSDTFRQIIANHITVMDAMMRFMLVEAGPDLKVVE